MLFTDLVGSTSLLSTLDPVAADEHRHHHFAVLTDALAQHGGTHVKNLGDGIMAAFTSVGDAARCAVAMQQAMTRLSRRQESTPHHIRIGISVGDATHDAGDWFGRPVVEAARLCAAA